MGRAAPSPQPRPGPLGGRALARPSRASGSTFPGTRPLPVRSPTLASVTRFGLWTLRCKGRRTPHPSSPSGRQSSSRVRSMTPLSPRVPTPALLAAAQSIWAPVPCPLRSLAPSLSTAQRPQCCRLCAVSPPTQWKLALGWSLSSLGHLPPACSSSGARGPLRGSLTLSLGGPSWAKDQLSWCRGRLRQIPGRTRTSCPTTLSLAQRNGR